MVSDRAFREKEGLELIIQDTLQVLGQPSDPLLADQWHTGTDTWSINVRDVWDDYTGAGVLVGILDDGFDYTHPDLAPNYRFDLDYDFLDNDSDARDSESTNRHGTAVAGLIAADDNGTGTVGVAFDADIVGYRMGFGNYPISQVVDPINRAADTVDVFSNSWSFTSAFSDNFKQAGWEGVSGALLNLAENGRGGLGTVAVFAAGNDRDTGGNANYHNVGNSPYTISVAATDQDGTYSWFSSPGANLLVTAPGTNLRTTDKTGSGGYDSGDFTWFGGTSGSTPIVSGVIALMLEANAALGYRDVQEILAYSARQNDPFSAGWQFNGAGNWNGGGLHFSHDYGFGLVDARAAVRLAETWQGQNTYATMTSIFASASPALVLPDQGTVITTLDVTENVTIEHILINLDISHSWGGDLIIKLTGPDGTESTLANRVNNGIYSGTIDFVFSSTAHWGENSAGTWTLNIQDAAFLDSGMLNSWSLEFLGKESSADDRYIFTDEFGAFSGSDLLVRSTIADTNGGTDTVNLAAVTTNSTLDLATETGTIAGKAVTIAPGTVIEVVYGGDGNDFLSGNIADNALYGGRGNDDLRGGSGSDILYGEAGDDVLYGEEENDILIGGEGSNELYGGAGADLLVYRESALAGMTNLIEGEAGIDAFQIILTATTHALQSIQDDLVALENAISNGLSYTLSTLGLTVSGVEALDVRVDLVEPYKVPLIALNDDAETEEGQALTLDTMLNDFIFDPGSVFISGITQGANGTVVLNPDHTITYTPAAGYVGADSFTYTIEDGNGERDVGTVALNILPDPSPAAPEEDRVFLLDPVTVNTLPHSPEMTMGGPYAAKTISVSFTTGADVTARQVLYEQGGYIRGINLFVESGRLYLAAWNKGEENWGYKELDTGVSADTAYTATLVLDGAFPLDGTLTGYVNGVEVGQASGVGLLYQHGGDVGIGWMKNATSFHGQSATGNGYNFTGALDKLAQYNAALTGADLDQLHEYMAWEVLPDPSPAAPEEDRVFLLDPVTVNTLPHSPEMTMGGPYAAKTISVSFTTGADVTARQVLYEQGGYIRGINLFVESGRLYLAAWNKGEENWGYKELDTGVSADTAYTATLVLDGAFPLDGTLTGYVNGVEVGQASGVGLLYQHGGDVGIGWMKNATSFHGQSATGNGYNFTGTLDKLVQYNAALTGAELDQLHEYMAWEVLPDGTITGTQGDDDPLSGTIGEDVIYGLGGSDVLYGDDGKDVLYGGSEADRFVFEAPSAFNDVDVIGDFSIAEGDAIDIADLLTGYDPLTDAIADFVQITDNGTDSFLAVDADGGADNFVQVAELRNVIGLTDEEALETAGNLITA